MIFLLEYYKVSKDGITEGTKEDYDWLNICNPSDAEIDLVANRTYMNADDVGLILSNNQSNRIEGLAEPDIPLTLILQYPIRLKHSLGDIPEFDTNPIIAILTNGDDSDDLITISRKQPKFLNMIKSQDDMLRKDIVSKKDILLLLIYYLSSEFNDILSDLKYESTKIEDSLKMSTDNQTLYQIMAEQKTISSFVGSIKNNKVICDKIISDTNYFEKEEYTELARVASVELNDAYELAQQLDYLLDKYAGLSASIVGNNQAKSINKLTMYTIVLSVIATMCGALGINYPIPGENAPVMFWVAITSMLVIGTVTGVALKKILK